MNLEQNLNSLENLLNEQIAKVTNKGDITPTELENMTKTLCLLEKIKEYKEYMSEDEGSSHSYGTYRIHGGRSMVADPYMDDYSRSRTYSRADGHVRTRGYSGHSIKDRMVAKLESMYDEAKTDHERQIVDEWIDRLNTGN